MACIALLPAPVATPRAVESDAIADLALIFQPEVNLCAVRRQVAPDLAGFVTRLLSGDWNFETQLRVAGDAAPVGRLLPGEVQALPGAGEWLDDVGYLIDLFRDLFGPDGVGLRLRTLGTSMCPRFHMDNVPVRLVCTYGGPGTEWLSEAAMNRDRLGHGAHGLPDGESGLLLDPQAIRALPPYAIGLMKGRKWAGDDGLGAVHRSPALTREQPRRLLLTLDAL